MATLPESWALRLLGTRPCRSPRCPWYQISVANVSMCSSTKDPRKAHTLGGRGVSESVRTGLAGCATEGDLMSIGAGAALRAEVEIMVVQCSDDST